MKAAILDKYSKSGRDLIIKGIQKVASGKSKGKTILRIP